VSEIRIAVAGVGNCTSSLVQGRFCYKNLKVKEGEIIPGLMHPELGGYKVTDIVPVVAFDVDARKVGRDLSEAIWAAPNCTQKISDVPHLGMKVLMGPVMDGVSEHLKRYVKVSDEKEIDDVDKASQIFKEAKVDVLVNNLPTASEKAHCRR
jgi:myo-inositol-1-phosphate synthase